MRRNYHWKLSASIYHHAKNVGIIGILPYPKIKSKRIHNISVHINFYQNRFINESVRKNFLKIS